MNEDIKPLPFERIKALPEASGMWPMGLQDRIVKLVRAVERTAVLADREARADELAAEQRRADMYADLVRRTAEALGLTRADGWHDLPERAAALVADREERRERLTDDEVYDLVREADLDWQQGWTLDAEAPNRFAALVRAVEQRCAAAAPQPAQPEARGEPAKPIAQVSIDPNGGNKRLTWYSYQAMHGTEPFTKLYAAPRQIGQIDRFTVYTSKAQ